MAGEDVGYGFSTNGVMFLAFLIGLSVASGLISRKVLFPRIMDLFSKSDRIDGKTLFAPRSLGWMIVLLVIWLPMHSLRIHKCFGDAVVRLSIEQCNETRF